MSVFYVLTPFSNRLKIFKLKTGISSDAYELKLKDFGISYIRRTK